MAVGPSHCDYRDSGCSDEDLGGYVLLRTHILLKVFVKIFFGAVNVSHGTQTKISYLQLEIFGGARCATHHQKVLGLQVTVDAPH